MTPEENKAVVRRFLDEVIGAGNMSAAVEVCTADLVWHGAGVGELVGLEAFTHEVAPFFSAFPDLAVTPEDMLAEGDKVVCRYRWRGTHNGEFFGISATDKQVMVTGVGIYRIADGKIAEEWWLEDLLGLMRQLGAIPSPAHPEQSAVTT
jgi:steroid delta-isomerase-like uncharacterized protein